MDVRQALAERRSIKGYDPDHEIDDATLRELFEQVAHTPSSFNLQHWRFVVVRDPKRKDALQKAAMNQPQVGQASAVIIVCAKLKAYEDAEVIYAAAPEGVRKGLVSMIHGSYADKPEAQRDEAIRSAGLASMALMIAAHAMGLATGPMIGFSPQQVGELIELEEGYIPAMIIVLGKQKGDPPRLGMRHALGEIVRLESFTGQGLE